MITALYGWAKYKATKDGITISPEHFNAVMEKVCYGKWTEDDLTHLYNPIKDLFEIDPLENPAYSFMIIDGKHIIPITQRDMKYIMQPRRNLTGKAKQAIGGSQFTANFLRNTVKKVGGKFKKSETISTTKQGKKKTAKIYNAQIPKNKLLDFWRLRLLDTFFRGKTKLLQRATKPSICCFCGSQHYLGTIRFIPPVNLFVENIDNYTPYLSGEYSHSLCPYCSMLFMRTAVEENAPEKVRFFGAPKAYLYILPYDPESAVPYDRFNKRMAERLIRSEFDKLKWNFTDVYALDYLLMLPILVFAGLPKSIMGKIKPSLYIIFAEQSGQAEAVVDQAIVTRFDFLARVGQRLKSNNRIRSIFAFKQRLQSFINEFSTDQKVNGYKIIFKFLAKLLANGEVNFSLLHRILRKEVTRSKRKNRPVYLLGFAYLDAFLKEVKYG